MEEGTAFYQNIDEAGDSPFARRLFAIEGVSGVFFGSDFITITKSDAYEWQVMKPSVLGGIIDHFNSEDKTVEKATQKAHLQVKPSDNAKYKTSNLRLLKKVIKLEENDDTRTKKDKGSGSQATKGSGKNE